jgi:hypothetical protein
MLSGSIQLFIHYESMNIFYINLQNPKNDFPVDVQLVSGYLAASTLFFNELGLGNNDPLFRIVRGQDELRMWLGNQVHGTMLLRNLPTLTESTYAELDELLKSIVNRFEHEYLGEIQTFMTTGRAKFGGIEGYIRDEVEKMKAHMYSSYLMQIIGVAINRNIYRARCQELLASFNPMYSNSETTTQVMYEHNHTIRGELNTYQNAHVTMARIIDMINTKFKQIWILFQIPMISPVLEPQKSKKVDNIGTTTKKKK